MGDTEGEGLKTRKIYTEHIHHVSCVVCNYVENTMDSSHEITKRIAAMIFETGGWAFVKGKGWHCPECMEQITRPEKG